MREPGNRMIYQEAYGIENEKTVIKIPFQNILEVTKKELIYRNNENEKEKISLDECVKNFNSALGADQEKTISDRGIKAVGGRCFGHPVAFYEFYTDGHHIRFVMRLKQTPLKTFFERLGWNVYSKEFSAFYALQKKLHTAGYSTMDLT